VPITYSQNYDPSLSPEGKRMVFLKALEGHETLFIGNSDGSGEKQLLRGSAESRGLESERFLPVEHSGNVQQSLEEAAAIAAEVRRLLSTGTVTDRHASCFQPKIRRTFSENGELSKW